MRTGTGQSGIHTLPAPPMLAAKCAACSQDEPLLRRTEREGVQTFLGKRHLPSEGRTLDPEPNQTIPKQRHVGKFLKVPWIIQPYLHV